MTKRLERPAPASVPPQAPAPHSADQFVPFRDHWYHRDFVELISRRCRLSAVRRALDVGAGVGHWHRVIAPHLAPDAAIVAIEREPDSMEKGRHESAPRPVEWVLGAAERLPFDGSSFDLVTCQTLLMHVPDPLVVLREMSRVLAPGGLLLLAEPNNLVESVVRDSVRSEMPMDDTLRLVRMQWLCERGKQRLGEGDNSVGDLLPGMVAALGFEDVAVCCNDKAWALFPPYPGEQAVLRAQLIETAHEPKWLWSEHDTRRYFLAGGGDHAEFTDHWHLALERQTRTADALARGTFHGAGGGVHYLIRARKPQ